MKSLFLIAIQIAVLQTIHAQSKSLFDLSTATIADLQSAMDKGDLSAETLTQRYLERIDAYDKEGPRINSVIALNEQALATARMLDEERNTRGPRGPLHGIPVALKDNIDTADLPTTAGCSILAGSIPPDDAFLVKKLRDAGAIVLFKANLAEFASSGGAPEGYSSMGGQTRNPYDPTRGPSGSSGGPGAAIAASFAQVAIGTDTSSSVRAPCAANGLAGIRPTLGLVSRDGIVPLSLSFDTAGPMARNIYDVAATLDVIAGYDSSDTSTEILSDKEPTSYTGFLKPGALKGARIGVAKGFMGEDIGTQRIMKWSLVRLRELGAEIVEPVAFPRIALESRSSVYHIIRHTEFPIQVSDYLATLKPEYPRSLADLLTRAEDPLLGYTSPWKVKDYREELEMTGFENPIYQTAANEGRTMIRKSLQALFDTQQLDAIIYATQPHPANKIDGKKRGSDDALTLAPLAGFPEVVVPAGMTADGLPVTLSFLGTAFRDGELLGYAFDFEQVIKAYELPKTTPLL